MPSHFPVMRRIQQSGSDAPPSSRSGERRIDWPCGRRETLIGATIGIWKVVGNAPHGAWQCRCIACGHPQLNRLDDSTSDYVPRCKCCDPRGENRHPERRGLSLRAERAKWFATRPKYVTGKR